MPRSRALLGTAAASALLVLPAAAQAKPATDPVATAAARTTVITMSGSTSVAPLAAKLAKAYIRSHKKVKFKLAQGGSDIGVSDVAAGRVSIGNSSRDPKPSDPGGIVFNKVARDAICLATNPSNKIANLSQEQVQDIFSGKVRDWSQVSGARVKGPINLVVRTNASGTQDAFQKLFMGSSKVASSAAQKASNGLVAQAIKSDPRAIGYISLAFTRGLNDAAYKGVRCTLRGAKSGQYEGARNFWMVTRGKPKGATAKFLKWIQKSKQAKKIVATEWVPLS
jgi:phosphate transport system substrate-binding protein